MEKKHYNEALRFYLLATKLKYKIRSGWDANHWNISYDRLESVAEHIYGTCILAISLESEFIFRVDMLKVLKMLICHEIGEVLIGDITPFDGITQEEKDKMEFEAINKILGDLTSKDEISSLLKEFIDKSSKEAIFAYHCDKLEANLQCKIYQDIGCIGSLEEQENNVAFKSSITQEILQSGAKMPFDVWQAHDTKFFEDDPIFKNLYKLLKDFDTQQNFT